MIYEGLLNYLNWRELIQTELHELKAEEHTQPRVVGAVWFELGAHPCFVCHAASKLLHHYITKSQTQIYFPEFNTSANLSPKKRRK